MVKAAHPLASRLYNTCTDMPTFTALPDSSRPADELRQAISCATRMAETDAVARLLPAATLPPAQAAQVAAHAQNLVEQLRAQPASAGRQGLVQGLLQEFSLSSQEGVALMCLAEALLRIPDAATRDALIRDKLRGGDWQAHLGKSPSLFVNAAAWGLVVTGKLVDTHSEFGLLAALKRITARGGEPLVRKGVDMAMRLMGEQFVMGETISKALERARELQARGFRYSYDMLGEAALTAEDAQRYMQSYVNAIHAIGKAAGGKSVYERPGISIKLSALHPRYSRAQWQRVMTELLPRVLQLCELARSYDIGLNIDAEEADRLELSLDLLEQLAHAPALAGWSGLGFVIQAYQKRCPYVIDYLIDLARRSERRLMVRLVKGAYWDSEIKRAQIDGLSDYPVYTRKHHTDVAYIACARKLLAAPSAIYPQFATHNAQTVASIESLAGAQPYSAGRYEFQCLHGMGEQLYLHVVEAEDKAARRPCRIYAPVGTHETLLAYLVRRLLENGANSSFVHRIANPDWPISDLIAAPADQTWAEGQPGPQTRAGVEALLAGDDIGLPHPRIVLPRDLLGEQRRNSSGLDLSDDGVLSALSQALAQSRPAQLRQGVHAVHAADTIGTAITNPASHQELLGYVSDAGPAQIQQAMQAAAQAQPAWESTPAELRASLLQTAAELFETQMQPLMSLLMREAGKTAANAVSEVREAVDFLRYYAAQIQRQADADLLAPGIGPVVCISPWNFPLAIFTGQVAAALGAGNVVLAKPAEQTPLIALEAVRLLHQAGIAPDVLQLLPGRGETVGAALVADARVSGVLFTGSTEVARLLALQTAARLRPDGQPVVLVAETGGQNAMLVDSSALVEQAVQDIAASAFDSAGQRCSALRLLCVQNDCADRLLAMLRGAMQELHCGNPAELATDVGPVIDADAKTGIERHIARLRALGLRIHQSPLSPETAAQGHFVAPTLIELPDLHQLKREVFGPVLHVLRYQRRELPQLLERINALGYGLTMGLHTRIDETVQQVAQAAHVGNLYVNRNMVGAVVGVQPFGGEGLSGTGPKAGGPLYLPRLQQTPGSPLRLLSLLLHQSGQAQANATPVMAAAATALRQLGHWARQYGEAIVSRDCERLQSALPDLHAVRLLPGPTGERNLYQLLGKPRTLCLAQERTMLLQQLAAALACGSQALWMPGPLCTAVHGELPEPLRRHVLLLPAGLRIEEIAQTEPMDSALLECDDPQFLRWAQALARRPGPLILPTRCVAGQPVRLERLWHERALSHNTAAAGGNAALMTLE
ncbi:trifunctional transcriptional regulator/proline dehydrogenase/L-glutamate gamma-semialdehyde dehydrogenase [Comamonas testosteroni]|uniref:trifunctional transcriptional regulator/proline dehydrogenase/L-glutamate gamma-semialdehyde dehydrogenase n=1 Tax=Comamonas testosteroni TaxID=285 RepID=UPI0026F201DA|nr:trifunctional transcriptional regulator/proline dehydrogenase/L-glutamate gamma-semialdehyde dehydrogenase [Comamonas testosteroni]WQD41532.1 trifunctional transcriptional regulator/proline dehydrogenase/L-glutamate gamma-semialdehyde dehydrogenase [Comamonas testosteroni]